MLGEQDITDQPMYRRARLGISYLAQEPSAFRRLTVEDNSGWSSRPWGSSPTRLTGASRTSSIELGLSALRRQRAETLSGGERRRLEIARSLSTDPTFVLLDEPFAGIDPIAVLDLQRIIVQLKALGIGVLITDHNVRETLKITDRAYIIKDGKIFAAGDPVTLAGDAEVRRIYLGEDFRL